jgi:hypothetical protein
LLWIVVETETAPIETMLTNFQISEAARREIERLRLCRPEEDLVAAISFVFVVPGRRELHTRWAVSEAIADIGAAASVVPDAEQTSPLSVGLHVRDSIPQADIFAVDGTDVAVSPTWQPCLAGRVLDLDHGEFRLTEAAA